MGPLTDGVVVEILDRAGSVRARSRHDRFPVRIGRGYDNDVIVEDEYVSPSHLIIERDAAGALRAVDLGSTNGLHVARSPSSVGAVSLGSDTLLRIGRTSLRIRTPEHRVAPAAVDPRRFRTAPRVLDNVWTFGATVLLTAGVLLLDAYWETYTRPKFALLLLVPIAVVAALFGWAGLWSLTSRLYAHQSFYFAHAVIACLGALAFLAFDSLLSFYSFAVAAELSGEVAFYVGLAAIATAVLYAHLRFCGTRARGRLALVSGLIVTAAVSLGWLTAYVVSTESDDTLEYPSDLKPLSFKLAPTTSLDGFVERTDALRRKADKLAQD